MRESCGGGGGGGKGKAISKGTSDDHSLIMFQLVQFTFPGLSS